eukprot:3275913-Pleurochrysis_carterae.AAC.1
MRRARTRARPHAHVRTHARARARTETSAHVDALVRKRPSTREHSNVATRHRLSGGAERAALVARATETAVSGTVPPDLSRSPIPQSRPQTHPGQLGAPDSDLTLFLLRASVLTRAPDSTHAISQQSSGISMSLRPLKNRNLRSARTVWALRRRLWLLNELELCGNLLSGTLPNYFFAAAAASLNEIELYGNLLSGSVPDSVAMLRVT